MGTKRAAIVVADDFGLSPGLNRGVIEAHRRGPVTSASLLVNMPGFADAVERLQETPSLAIGLHLNLTFGRPVSPPDRVRSLVGSGGEFLPFSTWLWRWARGRIDGDDIYRECRAQAQRLVAAGLQADHCDVHQHLDAISVVARAVVDVCKEFGIAAVRPLREQPTWTDFCALNLPGPKWRAWPTRVAKFSAMRLMGTRTCARYAAAGLWMPDACVGLFVGGGQDAAGYRRIFASLRPGVSEVCVHPAYVDEGLRATPFKFIESRELELKVLTAPEFMAWLREQNIELTTYGCAATRQLR